jgi:ferrous iron transport protein B
MSKINLCLLGNPNSGKSSLYNKLTGLNQKVSNFPGVTVEKKVGSLKIGPTKYRLIDLPGLYSIYPNSLEEKLVVNVLMDKSSQEYPDKIIYVVDLDNLERHLLLATQLIDLGFELIIALNMADKYKDKTKLNEIAIHLKEVLGVPILPISTLDGFNIDKLKELISSPIERPEPFYYTSVLAEDTLVSIVKKKLNEAIPYRAKIFLHHHTWIRGISEEQKKWLEKLSNENQFENIKGQIQETLNRFSRITPVVEKIKVKGNERRSFTEKIDDVITHKIIGPVIFFSLMFFLFQTIFSWSEAPMEWIEDGFSWIGTQIQEKLSKGWFTDLLVDGLIAGLGGILVFVPQITILFILVALLEESGYMSRAVYLFDPLMRKLGLNGRSMVSLISSGACAIPAIMSTRTISNWKERITTIMVSPLISCSARIPVYTILVSFVVPDQKIGWFNLQGIVFMGLYMTGIISALVSAFVFKQMLRNKEDSYLILELPLFKKPQLRNILLSVKEKVWSFIEGAGKIIIIISLALWFLASYGPIQKMEQAEKEAKKLSVERSYTEDEYANILAAKKIEASYIGHLGKFIEPAIAPLGFDWKIGIALITSFAAREVFVGTMATIYSIGSSDTESRIKERMSKEYKQDGKTPVFNPATSLSLLIFYVFAMQCMSTLAVTRKETNSWKWPIIQFLYMTLLAYGGSLLTFNLMNNWI